MDIFLLHHVDMYILILLYILLYPYNEYIFVLQDVYIYQLIHLFLEYLFLFFHFLILFLFLFFSFCLYNLCILHFHHDYILVYHLFFLLLFSLLKFDFLVFEFVDFFVEFVLKKSFVKILFLLLLNGVLLLILNLRDLFFLSFFDLKINFVDLMVRLIFFQFLFLNYQLFHLQELLLE